MTNAFARHASRHPGSRGVPLIRRAPPQGCAHQRGAVGSEPPPRQAPSKSGLPVRSAKSQLIDLNCKQGKVRRAAIKCIASKLHYLGHTGIHFQSPLYGNRVRPAARHAKIHLIYQESPIIMRYAPGGLT